MKNTTVSVSTATPTRALASLKTLAPRGAFGAAGAMPVSRPELALLMALGFAVLVACFGPSVAQHAPYQANYHAFADHRSAWGLPFAMDVLSNMPFAIAGGWGLVGLRRLQRVSYAPRLAQTDARPGAQPALAALFFMGLIVTAVCSSLYHWQPDNAGLAIDRLGMVVAFAGLLGLAVADRISARAGLAMSVTVLILGPVSVMVWATSANLLPWALLQGGGMLLIVLLAACPATCKPIPGAWGIPLAAVIALYALAKVFELADHAVFELTQHLVSGHSLKHVVAALAALPVIRVMHNRATAR